MAVQYLDTGNEDGTVLGQSASELVGFHGVAVDQAGAITLASAATIATIRTAVRNILIALREKGLIAT